MLNALGKEFEQTFADWLIKDEKVVKALNQALSQRPVGQNDKVVWLKRFCKRFFEDSFNQLTDELKLEHCRKKITELKLGKRREQIPRAFYFLDNFEND
ncbi:hypothetical protein [Pleionea sp. CnH1-48]|uniref:hypothetical protein n=1 Tax=Pleionea sp. CnH1-48 TaxID=2954494 RepID=UPI0020982189|nr:hypothetical protein [Pleionea sp. CnH1-48]MCO7225974.1 hypothetical protein [Pleionea sp. CnH1-48]